jgi:hypothetical protein
MYLSGRCNFSSMVWRVGRREGPKHLFYQSSTGYDQRRHTLTFEEERDGAGESYGGQSETEGDCSWFQFKRVAC